MPLREPPPEPGRAENQRRVRLHLAQTDNWPEGVLEATDKLADRFPAWFVCYRPTQTHADVLIPAAFQAFQWSVDLGPQQVQGVDADGLATEIDNREHGHQPDTWFRWSEASPTPAS